MNLSGTVIGVLSTGGFAALLALIAPFITKKLNRATDAASAAERLSASAVALAGGFEGRIEQAEQRCSKCLHDLAKARRTTDALLDAVTEIVPLLPGDSEETEVLRAAIRTARQSRYNGE